MPPESPLFEGYTVIGKIESGPLTDLFHARQTALGRAVTIKALNPNLLPTSPFAQSLEREAVILSAMQHVNVVQLFDFRKTAREMWLVLEHVDGWYLSELTRTLGVMPAAFAVGVMVQLAAALTHAHARGIVHRALRPENVWVSKSGEVKLSGFGQAFSGRMPTAPELIEGEAGFTGPAYLSPEQVLGEGVDPRSDLFSAGVILYEMLTGTRPFDGQDSRTTAERIRHEAPPPLVRSKVQIPVSLERVTLRCLQKLASDRFANAAELKSALEAIETELGERNGPASLLHGLERAQLIKPSLDAAASDQKRLAPRLENESNTVVRQAFMGFVAGLFLIVAGAVYLRFNDNGSARAASDPTSLPVPQAERAHVNVVVDPWANVYVDGVRFDTTPFAEAIPLSPGVHYFRFEHPNAPNERREVTLAAGETVLLDVKMKIVAPPPVKSSPLLPGVLPQTPDAGP